MLKITFLAGYHATNAQELWSIFVHLQLLILRVNANPMETKFAREPSKKGSSPVQDARYFGGYVNMPLLVLNCRRSVLARPKDIAIYYAKIAKEWQRSIVVIRLMHQILIPVWLTENYFA